MKRPKKTFLTDISNNYSSGIAHGWNQAYDAWEKFLPNKAEIKKLIDIHLGDPDQPDKYDKEFIALAKAISKRLGDKKWN